MQVFRFLLMLALVTLLNACASNNLAVQDHEGKPIEAPISSFKLQNVQVVWVDNTAFDWQLRSAINAGNLQRYETTNPVAIARAKSDIQLMYGLLKNHAGSDLMESLAASNVRAGVSQTIELRPENGYWSESGWGSGVVIEITITDHSSQRVWKHKVQADTGIQMIGAMAAPVQDRNYVRSFVSGLLKEFSKSKLI
jgi:hypothetical protein